MLFSRLCLLSHFLEDFIYLLVHFEMHFMDASKKATDLLIVRESVWVVCGGLRSNE